MQLLTYDDITGDGTKQKLTDLLKVGGVAVTQAQGGSKWWQAVMTTASGVTRIGNSTISSTNGIPIGAANNGQFIPAISFATDVYDLSQVYCIINSGDVMSVARGI